MQNSKLSALNRALLFIIVTVLLVSSPVIADYHKVGGGLNFFSESQEIAMGRQYSAQLNKKLDLVRSSFINDYINQIGQNLARHSLRPNLQYHFFVVNTPDVNAFALPGGFIYVNRGLIEAASNESELSGVIGHEIGHVVGRHAMKQMSKKLLLYGIVVGAGIAIGAKSNRWGQITQALGGIGVFLASLKYSRDDERQADWLGLKEMTAAGYDPEGMVTFFKKLDALSKKGSNGPGLAFLRTHPLPTERISNMEREIKHLEYIPHSPIKNTYSFNLCKIRLAAIPLPPKKKGETLSSALREVDRTINSTNRPQSSKFRASVFSKIYTIQGKTTWLNTGINLKQGDEITIIARGKVFWKKHSTQWCTPDGAPGTKKGFWKPLPKANTGTLIGKIGHSSYKYFVIGSYKKFISNKNGRLFIGINDDNNFDNRGYYKVKITVKR